ncbi:WD repeat-containing and planar cell polarity effector protein fritz isoform X1 [Vanessa cardui]|uniref:WD repeat-containing and planar cell polarity effector protein fritz isoform X1 n=1 Tax=Vanessa cardui TaxID=171605 RepID=UPI001F1343C3|nr:WD repeat-containing and planar cell polarity effector protein fritz isoform X1 [Vanessa cardui]
MFTYDVKFLTSDDLIYLKNNDFKSYKYESKKKLDESIHDIGKRSYCERRGGYWRSPKPRQLRQLESKLRDRNIVCCEWVNESLIVIVFSSGVIAYITVKYSTLDITQILFDRYCIGKINSQTVTGVVLCKKILLLIHMDKVATLITFGKTIDNDTPCQISDRDPHLQILDLGGSVRKVDRRVSWCESANYVRVLIWGATVSEPAPWSPVLEDHANLHLYQIVGHQVSLLAYHQLENEVLFAELSHKHDHIIHIVEQIACHKTGASLVWHRYELPQGVNRMTKLSSLHENTIKVSLPAPARLARRSPCDIRILVACIDASIHVIHNVAGLTHSTKAGFIATDVRWAGELIVAAEEAGRLQCFDRALSLLHHHSKCLDLTSYMRESKRVQLLGTHSRRGGSLILATLAGGPLVLLRITHPRLLTAWLRSKRFANAVGLLRALEWDEEGAECVRATRAAVRAGAAGGAAGAQLALGAYLAPRAPLPAAAHRYAPAVHDLARKFFHHLVRRGHIEKALSLAVDLEAWDLFADARWAAKRLNLSHLAEEAANCAAYYAKLNRPDSECSDSCSQCSSHSYTGSEEESSTSSKAIKTNPPPLPRVPLPSHPSILTVPINQNDTYTTTSIRPNLHQYLERDSTIWGKNVQDDSFINKREPIKPIHSQNMRWNSVDNVLNIQRTLKNSTSYGTLRVNQANNMLEVLPRSQDERISAHFKHLFQTELREDTNSGQFSSNVPSTNSNFNERYRQDNFCTGLKPEKNKVKFSDTVTVAVVPKHQTQERPGPDPSHELADSLPLCAPHRYLAAFAPHAPPAPPAPPHAPHAPPGTTLDYVEV